MSNLYPLQAELFRVLKENATGLFEKTCSMTSAELHSEMKIKPCTDQYISRILQSLQKKGKVRIERRQEERGLRRVVVLLNNN